MKKNTFITTALAVAVFCLGCSREYELEAQFGSVKITPLTGLATSETGGTATFQVVLSYPPKSDVVFSLKSSNATEGLLRANGANCDAVIVATADTCTLRFTPSNWDIPQSVVAVGQDDALKDGNIAYKVTAPAGVVSDDPRYNGLSVPDVSFLNNDNDAGAGFVLSRTSGLVTTEAPAADSFSIRLASQPSVNVILDFASNTPSEGTPAPTFVTFTTADWSTDRTIIVTGVADQKLDGNVAYKINIAVRAGSDSAYTPLAPPSVDVTNNNTDAGKYIFVTAASYVGAPSGLGGIAGADAKCNSDSARPNTSSTYKAIIGGYNTSTDTNVRDSTLNWVLTPGQRYYRIDDMLIHTATAAGILPFPLLRSFHTGAATYWTGLNPATDWESNTGVGNFNCANSNGTAWNTGGGAYLGSGSATANTAIYNPPSVLCSQSHNLLCAEQ